MKIFYATTNIDKFTFAKVSLAQHDIQVEQCELELPELQTEDGAEIARQKAQDAFRQLGKPVLVSDDSWRIPALKGFPGPNMKQCNHYLVAQDWLRLMKGVQDRRIFLEPFWGYSNGKNTFVETYKEDAYFLEEARGTHQRSPHLEVIAWKDQKESVAESLARNAFHLNEEFIERFVQQLLLTTAKK